MSASERSGTEDGRDATVLVPYVPRAALEWVGGYGHREVEGTLVSADISGFTALAERLAGLGREGSEELTQVLNGRLTPMIAWVHDRGGDVLKFGGDALLCLFTGDGHADRALQAAVGMRATLEEPVRSGFAGSIQLSVSTGMATGTHHLLLLDADGYDELLVVGPGATATVTAEGDAGRNQVLASPATAAALRIDHRAEPAGDWVALEAAPPSGRVPADPRPLDVEVATSLLPPSHHRRLVQVGPGIGEHRRAVVLFVQWQGLDDLLTHRGPAAAHDALSTLLAGLGRACDEHGVQLVGTDVAGDGGKVILAAGAMGGTEDHATGALLVARAAVGLDVPLRVRVGVNGGPIFVGDLGGPTRRALTVMGDAVNLAARLMARAEPGEVVAQAGVVDDATFAVDHEPLEPFLVKGKSVPIRASRVHDVTSERVGRQADAGTTAGRAEELATLRDAWSMARDGDGLALVLEGAPGMGKTELLDELTSSLGAPVHRGAGHPRRTARPYAATVPLWRSALDLPADRDRATAALTSLAETVLPDRLGLLPLLGPVLDLPLEPTSESAAIRHEFARERAGLLLLELLDEVVDGPAAMVVEDVHVADRASVELLAWVAERLAPRRWLVVLTSDVPVDGFDGTQRLVLGPLPDAVVRELVLAHAPVALTDPQVATIVERAEGNPLYATELAAVTGSGELPVTIEDAMARRLAVLEPGERVALSEAAVLGDEGDVEVATSVSVALRRLDWSRVDGLVERDARRFRFRNRLIRDAAYDALSYRHRRRLHAEVAEALERRDAPADLLSLHYFEARRPEAWKWSVLAAEHAEAQHAMADAASLYARAVETARRTRSLDRSEVARVTELLGDACEVASDFDRAREAYDLARRRFDGELVSDVRLMRKIGVLEERQARYQAAVRWYRRSLRRLEQRAGDAAGVLGVEAELGLAAARFRQGQYEAASEHATRAATGARHADDARSLAHAYLLLDNASNFTASEQEYANRAAALFRRAGDRLYEAHALNNMGVASYFRGDWDAAVELYEQAGERYDEVGDVRSAALVANNLGEVRSDQWALDAAGGPFADAVRGFEATGYELGRLVALANIGRLRTRAGAVAEALDVLHEARDGFASIGAEYYERTTRLRLAEAAAELGRAREALDHLDGVGDDRTDPTLVIGAERLRALLRAHLHDEDPGPVVDAVVAEAEQDGATYDLALTLLLRGRLTANAADLARGEVLLRSLGADPTQRPPGWSLLPD